MPDRSAPVMCNGVMLHRHASTMSNGMAPHGTSASLMNSISMIPQAAARFFKQFLKQGRMMTDCFAVMNRSFAS
jgi:hypothetical protein